MTCKAVQPGVYQNPKEGEWYRVTVVDGGKIRIKTRYAEADMKKEGVTLQGDSAPMPQGIMRSSSAA